MTIIWFISHSRQFLCFKSVSTENLVAFSLNCITFFVNIFYWDFPHKSTFLKTGSGFVCWESNSDCSLQLGYSYRLFSFENYNCSSTGIRWYPWQEVKDRAKNRVEGMRAIHPDFLPGLVIVQVRVHSPGLLTRSGNCQVRVHLPGLLTRSGHFPGKGPPTRTSHLAWSLSR